MMMSAVDMARFENKDEGTTATTLLASRTDNSMTSGSSFSHVCNIILPFFVWVLFIVYTKTPVFAGWKSYFARHTCTSRIGGKLGVRQLSC